MFQKSHLESGSLSLALAMGLGLILIAPAARAAGLPTTGPDVTINRITGVGNTYGAASGIRAYAVGTTSCNIGDTPVNWCNTSGGCGGGMTSKQHPVIAQGIYRLKTDVDRPSGRLEQIGMSWLKHGFLSTNTGNSEGACKVGHDSCDSPPFGGDQLGVGCRDTYGSSLNGSRPLGMRSEVNATTGDFPYPYTSVGSSTVYDQRIQVLESDVEPTLNTGARYWAEAQYIADNDAKAGNGLNNASYQEVLVSGATYNLGLSGALNREHSAIYAWQLIDPTVEIFNFDVPGAVIERFEVARKVTPIDGDTWHYEYAIRNLNSDRSARAFTVDFVDGTPVTNPGFKSTDHHSGEPYSTAAWDVAATQATGTVTWGTSTYANDPNANALRWATMFNFWFDADAAPSTAVHTLELFKPGSPESVTLASPIFVDGFASNNLTAWSDAVP
ncbi:MAG: hypothetical protein ABIV06_00210 [Thermoanaerobaculia bacterium]